MSRRCEVLTAGQGWREVPLAAVTAGMIFRLFEPDGAPVVDADGARRWRAVADARAGPGGEAEVDAEAVPDTDVELTVYRDGLYWPGSRGGSGSRLRG